MRTVFLLLLGLWMSNVAIAQAPSSVTYRYDDAGRLMSASYDGTSEIRYTYDAAGNITQVAIDAPDRTNTDAETGLPTAFALDRNYPNPFNPTTTIRYALPVASDVTLTIYDTLGRRIRTLVAATAQAAGYHTAQWDGRNAAGLSVASGVYLYQLAAGDFRQTHTMLLLK